MDDKTHFIKKYEELKKANDGEKPLYKDFLVYCNIHKRKLEAVFGRDAYTKLQEECGDKPNKLHMQRTPIKNILEQYGQLVRDINQQPVTSDWIFAKLKPSPDVYYGDDGPVKTEHTGPVITESMGHFPLQC